MVSSMAENAGSNVRYNFQGKIVIAPCTGVGQTVGTISRQAAYRVVEELLPDKTVLLCLPAYNVGVEEDVEMVRQNPNRIIAIEGCGNLCMSKLLKSRGCGAAKMVFIPKVMAEMGIKVEKSKNRAKLTELEEEVVSAVASKAVEEAKLLPGKD
jgi:uncharacterized metal-binding protein